ncbi:MAG: 5'-methylthioadenosine/adenosylhomocysteine nucleosidase [Coriobacteriales bacterium]|nr:5'-methylthioadenosine/adenosylhomocysteine nucleosidase [Coriobacteriales bacterium]
MKLGIIGAMESEVKHLCASLEDGVFTKHAGMDFCEGTLHGCNVVVVRCGIGKICAATCAQILVDLYGVTHIINTGVAGSVDNEVGIEDMVVSTEVIHHDVDVTALGYALCEVPGLHSITFKADPVLREAAVEACKQTDAQINIHVGRTASGDQFIAKAQDRKHISELTGALCCEMEGASIAQTCFMNKIPFVIVRAISDNADGSATIIYNEFEAKAAQQCAAVIERMVSILNKETEL